jgi:CDP-glucose 4,6-dehydratase
VLEACRLSKRVSRIIVASSDKAYGKSKKHYGEDDPLRGDHPYEVSKSATDLIAQTYTKTYKMPIVVTRFGNIYGEGDLNFSRIIPGIMKAIITKETLDLRSDGTFVRDYVYVNDVVGAYLLLLSKMDDAGEKIYNIGSKDTLSVLELIRISKRILHKPFSYRIMNDAKNEIPYQSLEYKRITQLGWKQQYRLTAVLPRIARWYKHIL